jgi:TatD DNase family protein
MSQAPPQPAAATLVDAHAHLSMPAFAQDLPQVLARARAAGVARIMTCATSLADAQRNLELVAANPGFGLAASVGFHPHEARHWDERSAETLRALLAAHPQIAAIGEVGLDFHYNLSPHDVQRDILRRQIALAREVRRPLIVHCRNAREDLKAIMLEERAGVAGGMLHCFTEDADFARFCLDQGFFVSFSGIITFGTAAQIREAAQVVPLDRLLVETDSPYLAPVPHRGTRNEPAHAADVARFVADLKGVTAEALGVQVLGNFGRLFGSGAEGS